MPFNLFQIWNSLKLQRIALYCIAYSQVFYDWKLLWDWKSWKLSSRITCKLFHLNLWIYRNRIVVSNEWRNFIVEHQFVYAHRLHATQLFIWSSLRFQAQFNLQGSISVAYFEFVVWYKHSVQSCARCLHTICSASRAAVCCSCRELNIFSHWKVSTVSKCNEKIEICDYRI